MKNLSHRIFAAFMLVGTLLFYLFTSTDFIAQDLQVYRQAGVSLLSGRNPYELPTLNDYASLRGAGFYDDRELQIWTPPFSLFVPLLLGLLSPPASKILWLLAYLAATTVGLFCYQGWRISRQAYYVSLILALVFMPLVLHGMVWGSVAPFECLPFFISVAVLRTDLKRASYIILGSCLFLMGFKPQLVVAPLIVYALHAITERAHARCAVIGASLTGIALCVTLYLRPTIFSDFLLTDRTLFLEHAKSAVPLPAILGAQPWVSLLSYITILSVAGVLLLILHQLTKHHTLGRRLVESSPLTFIAIPYCWLHDFLILVPWAQLVLSQGLSERSLVRRLLLVSGCGMWICGAWLLAKDLYLGHIIARYPFNLAIIAWVALRLLQLRGGREPTSVSSPHS